MTALSLCSALCPDLSSFCFHKGRGPGSSHKMWDFLACYALPGVYWRQNKFCWPAQLGSINRMLQWHDYEPNWLILMWELRLGSCIFDFPNMLGHRLVSQPKYLLCTTKPYLRLRIHFPGSDLGGDPVPYLLIHGSNVALQLKGSQYLLWVWVVPIVDQYSGWLEACLDLGEIMGMALIISVEDRK